jgi:hypothetical protein
MARRIIIGEILNLIKGLGGNPSKFMGTKSNISFLGKGPKESLFQGAIDAEGMVGSGFPVEALIREAETAGGYATANKLNDLQLQRLKDNLIQLKKAYFPPQVANITDMATGTGDLTQEGIASLREGVKRFPRETHQFFGRPLKDADFVKIDRMVMEGKIPDAKGRTWNFKTPKPGARDIPQKTYAARATMYKLLDMEAAEGGVTLREIMSKQDLKWLLEGGGGVKGDPIAMFAKYFGNATTKQLPSQTTPEVIEEFATQVMQRKDRLGRGINDPFFRREDIDFAGGGLAEILQVPRTGFKYGSRTIAKGALAFLKKNKKNAEYMFKASDNVSPGYAHGDMKYNAELLAEQLAEDAGVVYHDLDDLARTEFYGTAYQYLSNEMAQVLLQKRMLKDIGQKMQLSDFSPKGRKPNASGGLAKILEV